MRRFLSSMLIAGWGLAAFAADPASLSLDSDSPTIDARVRLIAEHPGVRFVDEGALLSRVYGVPLTTGASAEAAAEFFRAQYADVFGAAADELRPGNWFNDNLTQQVFYQPESNDYRFTLVYYTQEREGVPVFRGELRLLARNQAGSPIVWAGSSLRPLGDFSVGTLPAMADAMDASTFVVQSMHPTYVNFSAPQFVIFAGVNEQIEQPRLAVTFVADNGHEGLEDYDKALFVCDARNGAVIYTHSEIHHTDITGNVSGVATETNRADACDPESPRGLPYARVTLNNTHYFTDFNGDFTIPNAGDTQVSVQSVVRGRYFLITESSGQVSTINLNVTPPGPANFLHNEPNNNERPRSEVNTYIHANIIRDLVLAANPQYPTIATQLEFNAIVNLAQTCNAYYSGNAINFFLSGGGCNNTGFSTVVHHEYGHHIVATGGSGQDQYGEGMSDCAAVLVTDDPWLAVGFQSCTTPLRDANNNMQYPCSGEAHDCGRLISGAIWSLRNELLAVDPVNYMSILRTLTINSVPLHTGSTIDSGIPVDFLTLDDDDENLGNGSPHWFEITDAFSAHGFPVPELAVLVISLPNGRPSTLNPAGGDRMRVVITPLGSTLAPNGATLSYDAGAGFVTIPLVEIEPTVFDAVFPAVVCPTDVHFYVSGLAVNGRSVSLPVGAPSDYYGALAAFNATIVAQDNFETDTGWTVQNGPGLRSGQWQRGVPAGTGGRGDPTQDYDGSGSCWLTQNVQGDTDVDGGYTRLISPTIDLSSGDAIIEYARWYSNSRGINPHQDIFVVSISNDDGANWTTVETVGPVNEADGGWRRHLFGVSLFVTPTATMRIRFEASDALPEATVEAAVDGFKVLSFDCTATDNDGDLNCDGNVNNFDIDAFVLAQTDATAYSATYPNCNIMNADINDDGLVNNFDIDPFIALLAGP
ncbi:MAG: hypothetical protein JNG88_10870 [Phycisphaerales bacterium]|nr:hypothetical protein [Phycisphaerales bacterium]